MGEAIIAKIISGDYVDKNLKIIFGHDYSATHVFIDGKEINDVLSILIDLHEGETANAIILRKPKAKK